ncbi:uracil phosphoribosyltransferase [Rugosibacter aromaticivorans]|uniref:Uracil phosphoribosyltransferase n=1 Tax=Rugosibacter aromaticivorans TaxID=1565605 RepID=A0A0C5J3Z2_9PROT|nr:bifunctional pyr operon transcriptional regulator/uracil phosphoribosyltransferase PyrR [Rugosibacter aromaticivorans]AJP49682.1 uracil phosphoribosyltransferase [Rugosibacter aromaticivorans]TBR12768.1 MAG: bifunctional pyr operon transcriptional regulator/uracil phosphoribosyltransferase PyrR [Rugosibacter sp.]
MKRPDAEALCHILADQLRPHVDLARTALVGIHTGGAWVAERLHTLLGLHTAPGAIGVSFYRDDYSQRGLHANTKTSHIPFEIEGAHIIIVDDVLYTGRTIRAAMNELFDYGRPDKIELAVLADRGGRELPIAADFCAHTLNLPAAQMLELERAADGTLAFRLTEK